MSDFIKQIAHLLPGPVNTAKYFSRSGLDVIFPFYHAISERALPHMVNLYEIRTPKEFESDLEYLCGNFEPVGLGDFLKGKIGPVKERPPMVLTFDDGLVQCYEDIMPILLRKGIPATFFLNNAFIDNKSMFFRFKASLLVEILEERTASERNRAAEILHCDEKDIRQRLLSISYVEREFTDHVADLWGFSYENYLRMNPVYLSSIQIKKMISNGFEFGSHGIDHPLFSLLKDHVAEAHIEESVRDLQERYKLESKYFAFPFTDFGVNDQTIEDLFKKGIIDAGFGTAGLKDDLWTNYFQRIPMEQMGTDARKTIRGEINRRRMRMLTGRNMVNRGKSNKV